MTSREHIILNIKGMTCETCAAHVRQALENVPGVMEVTLPGWASERAEVVSEADVPGSVLEGAVEAAGYHATEQERYPEEVSSAAKMQHEIQDLVVIGGGSAGFAAAIRAAEEGARVLMVNRGPIGGTCVNIGCVPSKFLIRAMEAYRQAGENRFAGVHTAPAALHWSRLIDHKDALVSTLRRSKYEDVLTAYPQVTLVAGEARFRSDTEIEVGGETFPVTKAVIAVGASPWVPAIPGLQGSDYLTSTTIMSSRNLPRSLIVLGANAIGLELAQVFVRAGVDVTVVELLDRITPFEDEAVSSELMRYLEAEGIRFVLGANTRRVEAGGREGYRLHVQLKDGRDATLTAERLLVATGRRPNTGSLALEAAGVETNRRGAIEIDRFAQTSRPHIYAAGDCADLPQFVYVAAHSGTVAAENALSGNHRTMDLEFMPRVIFTDPQVAAVGLTESQARAEGHDVAVTVLPLEYVPQALVAGDTRGMVKLITEKGTGRLLGAHLVAPQAGEIVQIVTMAMKAGITIDQLAVMLFPYLTLAEGIKLAAQTFDKDIAKLSCCAG